MEINPLLYRRLVLVTMFTLVLAMAVLPAISTGVEAQPKPGTTPASVTFQVNPAHDGNLNDPALKPPLKQLWSASLGAGRVSYPVAVGDKVFVTVAHDESMGPYGSALFALNAATGAVAWGPVELGGVYWWSGLAYDNGKIFALNGDDLLRAYKAGDGTPVWSTQLPSAFSVSAPPTALNGIVYTAGSGWEGGGLYAIDEATGAQLWRAGEGDMHDGPAVTDSAVYFGAGCAQVRALAPRKGSVLWSKDTGCGGSMGAPTVYYNGKVYVRSVSPPNLLVADAKTGRPLQTYGADRMPVFAGSRAFFFANGNLQGVDEATGRILWTFAGEGDLTSNPLVVNNTLYIGSSKSRLYALDPASGSVLSTVELPGGMDAPDDWNGGRTVGMGAGNGRLFVPVGGSLVALASDTATHGCQLFKETGKSVCNRFLDYWNDHGGLAQQGFPISAELQEISTTNGKVYTVQYFERAVFEYHPDNKAPNDVLLSLLGVFRYANTYNGNAHGQAVSSSSDRIVFKDTGKSVGGKFLQYWQAHGGLAQQGFPISEEFTEKSALDGKDYTVQYFERAVFEYHPENPPPNDVLLSQLGTFRYHSRYEGPNATPATPAKTPVP
jgi:outer membrane protein assembly factor BamB